MAVRKKSKVAPKVKNVPSKAPVKSSGAWYENKKYVGSLIAGVLVMLVLMTFLHTLVFRDSVSSDFSVKFVKRITAMDSGSGPFQPGGIAFFGEDKLAVSDTVTKRILVFDKAEGKFLRFLGEEISNEERDEIRQNKKAPPENAFVGLGGLCSVDDNFVYAIDDQPCILKGYGENFKPADPVSLRDLGCYGPRSVNYTGKNFLVSDTGGHRILSVNRDSKVELSMGKHGDGNGELNNPVDVAVDSKGNYVVADFDNKRVQIFNAKGKNVKTIKLGSRPSGVALFSDGRILVLSQEGNFVRVYKDNGKMIGTMREVKNEVAFTSFMSARVDKDGTIYLVGSDTIVAVKEDNGK